MFHVLIWLHSGAIIDVKLPTLRNAKLLTAMALIHCSVRRWVVRDVNQGIVVTHGSPALQPLEEDKHLGPDPADVTARTAALVPK